MNLVVSFLQVHPKIQSGEIKQEENLGVLFIELLDLYGQRFHYDHVAIDIRGNGRYLYRVLYFTFCYFTCGVDGIESEC